MKTLLFQESLELVILIIFFMFIFKNNDKIFFLLSVLIFILIYFYRLPNRILKKNSKKAIISPCDGIILNIENTKHNMVKISIYLNIFDVHVQWYPTHGIIRKIIYKKGEFNLAYLLEKSKYNERLSTIIQNEFGIIRIDQIAGQLARRIVNWSITNTKVSKGKIMGMIKLSSRVDIYLPRNKVKLFVKKNQRIMGKISKIAEWI
jgi:phosphatidylserine decarboxylase